MITKRTDTVNLCPINYQAISSKYKIPLAVCIGLDNKEYTLETILETKEFIYAYPSREQLKQVLYCGTVLGRDVDKLANTDFEFAESEDVSHPNLVGAAVNLECKVVHSYNTDDFTILIGEILKMNSSDKNSLDKIYTLLGMRYGVKKEVDVVQEIR